MQKNLWPLILGLGITQIIGWGTSYYLLSILGDKIGAALNLPPPVIFAGVSITLAASAILGPVLGRLQDQHGSRALMATGSIMLAVGLGILSRAEGLLGYCLAWLLIGISTPMTLYNAAFTAITQAGGTHARRAITYLTFMGGLASTIFWPFAVYLLIFLDWREVVQVYAAFNLLICLPLHLALLPTRKHLANAQANLQTEQYLPLPKAAQPRAFALFATMLAINGFIFNAWSVFIFFLYGGIGFSSADTVWLASLVGVFQVVGRMGEMALGGRYPAILSGVVSAGLLPAAFLVLVFSGGNLTLGVIFALLYGISNGLLTITRGAVTLALFGRAGYGERLGKLTLPQSVMGALAPILGALMIEQFGSMIVLITLLILSVLAFAVMLLLARHARQYQAR